MASVSNAKLRSHTSESDTFEPLKKYAESHQFKFLQNIMTRLMTSHFPECVNLQIYSCNALKPVVFTSADVVIKDFVDLEILGNEDDIPKGTKLLKFTDIFETKTLNLLLRKDLLTSDEIMASDEFKSLAPVLLIFLDFFRDIAIHQEAIQKVKKRGCDRTQLSAVVAHHLFSKLIPGHKYLLDDRSENLSNNCPCGCQAAILKGCTALGSSGTWHGYVDILLNQSISVSLMENYEEDKDSAIEESDLEPPSKKMCRDEKTCQMCVEMKNAESKSDILYQMHTVDQIVAETITNGFAQVNTNKYLSGNLIPTFGCTSEMAYAFLYDSENDILLHTCRSLKLWQAEGVLDIKTVITFWLYLNFNLFCVKQVSKKYALMKSNFHSLVKQKLTRYHDVRVQDILVSSELSLDKKVEDLLFMGVWADKI